MTADLVIMTPFRASSVGMYKCEVRSAEGVEENVVSQLVELSLGSSFSSPPKYFQIHVSSRNCGSWALEEQTKISKDFQNLLYRVILTECDCDVSKDHLTVVSLQCSYYINGGAVFRGYIKSNSSSLTKKIYCTLSKWQKSGPFISINASLSAVDPQYSLGVESYQTEECEDEDTTSPLDVNNILIPISVIVGTLLVCVVLVLASVSVYCLYRHCSNKKSQDIDMYVS